MKKYEQVRRQTALKRREKDLAKWMSIPNDDDAKRKAEVAQREIDILRQRLGRP